MPRGMGEGMGEDAGEDAGGRRRSLLVTTSIMLPSIESSQLQQYWHASLVRGPVAQARVGTTAMLKRNAGHVPRPEVAPAPSAHAHWIVYLRRLSPSAHAF